MKSIKFAEMALINPISENILPLSYPNHSPEGRGWQAFPPVFEQERA